MTAFVRAAARFCTFALVSGASPAMALTLPGGNVGNQHWTVADSPVVIQGDATVQAGATLEIDAGVVVRFNASDSNAAGLDVGKVELTIAGTLDVNGTLANPVRFEGSSTSSGSWYGLVLQSGHEGVTVNQLEIVDAYTAIRAADSWTGSGLLLDDSSYTGLYQTAGTATVDGIEITDGSYGVYTTGAGTVDLSSCLVHHVSSYGVYSANSSAVTHELDYCTVANSGRGFYGYGSTATHTVNIRNSIVANNSS
ncbi:MAG: hypothetical protein EP330_05225, partial [Deltaproteobacteria bacterium]